MKNILIAASGVVLLTVAGGASAQGYVAPPDRYSPPPQDYRLPPGQTCPDGWRESAGWCLCVKYVDFYGPPPPPYNVTVRGPGVHVYGKPLYIPAGKIYVKGPPIYVDAPPVHVAGPDIYLQRPEIWVKPSPVTVEPPKVHVEDCKPGEKCEPVPASGYVDP